MNKDVQKALEEYEASDVPDIAKLIHETEKPLLNQKEVEDIQRELNEMLRKKELNAKLFVVFGKILSTVKTGLMKTIIPNIPLISDDDE